MMPTPTPSAPYYYPPVFTVGSNNNITSPLQPAMGQGQQDQGYGMNKGSLSGMMQFNNMLNQVNQIDGMSNVGSTGNSTTTTTRLDFNGPGMKTFSPSPFPISMVCPYCKNEVVTVTRQKIGWLPHIVAAYLCFLGCVLCFFCPYLFSCLKDIEHHCPQCGRYVGIYRKLA